MQDCGKDVLKEAPHHIFLDSARGFPSLGAISPPHGKGEPTLQIEVEAVQRKLLKITLHRLS